MIHWCYEEIKTMDTKVKRIFNSFLGLPSGSWMEAENCSRYDPAQGSFVMDVSFAPSVQNEQPDLGGCHYIDWRNPDVDYQQHKGEKSRRAWVKQSYRQNWCRPRRFRTSQNSPHWHGVRKNIDGLPTLKTPDKVLSTWHDHEEFGPVFQEWQKASRDTGLLDSTSCFRSKWSAWTITCPFTAPLRHWQRRCVVDNIDMKTMDAKSGFWKNIQSGTCSGYLSFDTTYLSAIHRYHDFSIPWQYTWPPFVIGWFANHHFQNEVLLYIQKERHFKMVPTSASLFQNP